MPLWHFEKAGSVKREEPTPGIYADLDSLISLSLKAKGFALLPRQPSRSILAGRHTSRLRGRGLDFEELRTYLPGDDIRTIDWKVTARMRKPHVRVYTEERDRPTLLVVDQRQAMFFGSQRNMKSVTAAEVAALVAWRVVASGDRVGAVVFNDEIIRQIRPHRSKRTVLRVLHAIEDQNKLLRADATVKPNPPMLNQALQSAAAMTTQNHLIIVISDFDGADDKTEQLLMGLASHNDVIAAMVYDPLRSQMPAPRDVVVTDGNLQVEVELGKQTIRRSIAEVADRRAKRVLGWKAKLGLTVFPLSSGEDTTDQIRHFLGHGPA